MTRARLLAALMAGTALAAVVSRAEAATAADVAAADADAATPTQSSRTTLEEIVVTGLKKSDEGGGLIKPQTTTQAISSVSSAYIRTQPALQNAYQYLQLTPGALVSTTDPFGLSEQFSINVHGLGQDELGYVLEGEPLNDIGFYTAYPSQFIDSENIDEVSLAQGSVDLDSPVISATGGLVTLTMLDPSLRPGGLFDASAGSFGTYRTFLRLDSGLIGDTGIRGFGSYSYTHSDQWHGPGYVKRQHADFKFVKEFDNGTRLTFSGEWHNGLTPTYKEPTLAGFEASGKDGPDTNYSSTFTPGGGDYWKENIGTFKIVYFSAPSKIVLNPDLTLNVTPYWQYGYGNSPYGTALTPDGNFIGPNGPYTINLPNFAQNGGSVMADYQDLQYRYGINSKLTYAWGPNHFIAGVWLDHGNERDAQPYSAITADGEPIDLWADHKSNFIRTTDGQILYAGKDQVVTNVVQPYIGDTLNLMDDRLTIEAGLKGAWIWRHGYNLLPGTNNNVKVRNVMALPRLGVRFKLDDNNQVFASATTNFRTPSESTLFDSYFGGQVYSAANGNLNPEYSISENVGFRHTDSFGTSSISFFHYYFRDRQIATVVGGNLVNQSVNAGHQKTYGIDVEWGGRPWNHISPYVSGEYLHSVYGDDLPVGDTFLPTAGKTSVRSPKFQGAIGLAYDDGDFFGNFNVKGVTSQYATAMNDEKIKGYATMNFAIGARLPTIANLRARPEIKLNLTNLTGHTYLSSVASPTSNAQDAIARDGTIVPGASPTYYLSGGFAALVTATQAF